MQWAERLLQGGETEQWGDKWEERFKEGKGSKKVFLALVKNDILFALAEVITQKQL